MRAQSVAYDENFWEGERPDFQDIKFVVRSRLLKRGEYRESPHREREWDGELILTDDAVHEIAEAIEIKFREGSLARDWESLDAILGDGVSLNEIRGFVASRQPFMEPVPDSVLRDAWAAIKAEGRYEPVSVCRASNDGKDRDIYMAFARSMETGDFSVWTCFNAKERTLNCGHHFMSKTDAELVAIKAFNDITGGEDTQFSLYGTNVYYTREMAERLSGDAPAPAARRKGR